MPDPAPALTEDIVATVLGFARSNVDPERIADKIDQYRPLLEMSRSDVFRPLGEIPPATAFNARWE
ncbi:hypothetical protein [Sediminivirga luteola]|uniref:Uncharacterized protein n=1 Tax=Sediminivirga luteola TaxID=1774748 RepID=A0A8J2TVP2_9MICO|nr:hypothetical protein [Sediminivirga luteola]GGA05086.1 hypothetical protein GCM10011333_04720 [Sediminivirga luteola]